ncbi:MAG: hypothetical protein HWD61_10810 [Parachlamydiaceae bacterium]|nr:MAG: hypothetical protein HWD61_10810 [Parachlamydiaceae bacterium]
MQAEKLGLKETNSKLIRHVNKIHTTLEEAGLLTLNPETGKAADEAVEIAIFNLIHDRKKLEEIAHSLAKLGFIEEKANYHAIETKMPLIVS